MYSSLVGKMDILATQNHERYNIKRFALLRDPLRMRASLCKNRVWHSQTTNLESSMYGSVGSTIYYLNKNFICEMYVWIVEHEHRPEEAMTGLSSNLITHKALFCAVCR
jgi:hypothetical protein